ncbi:MAG: hypothetical protein J3Q66DRAFT_277194 [Benniella sp.]|nr:MAG: hypothetical protein J3Q66DRAFT_277194 [Benniella sp.]
MITLLSVVYLQPSVPLWKGRHISPTSHHPNNHDRYNYDFDYHPDSNRQRAHEIERDVEQENHDWRNHEDVKGGSEWSGDGTPSQQHGEGRDLDRPHNYGSDSDPDSKDHPLKSVEPIDPESIVLYRILGNDLPPRHRPGQTLSNVRFILEHEPEFNNTRKLWVLNRIVDPHAEESIIQLLDHHRQEYIRIPFEEDEYLKQDFRLEDFPEPDFFSSDDYSTFSKVAKLRVLDYTYHDKNKYAMNNNGGRNIAIQHGKTKVDARWIFPFDGNSFLTKNAMSEIKQAIQTHGDAVKYLVVPMARLVDNSQLLKGVDTRPNSKEEPQIIFRDDADDLYNPDMRYGRRSKLELLWRLGALERSKISKPSVSWEPKEREPIPNKADFMTVGWVFRLFSGKRSQEENTRQSAAIRAYNRLLAIQDLIDGIDERIARKTFRSNNLLVYKDEVLRANRQKYWIGEPGVTKMVQELQSKACQVLSQRPIIPKSSPISQSEDASSKVITLQGLYDEVTTLTLAHYFTGNETFARAAANIVRTTLLHEHDQHVAVHPTTEETGYLLDHGYSFPALNRLPRVIPKKEGAMGSRPLLTIPKDLLKADTMPAFLDAVRMLLRIHVLTQNEYIQLNMVFSTWLEHLVNSPEGIMYAKQGDHRSSFMDLHVASLAAITDDVRLFLRVVNRCRMRVGRQFMQQKQQPLVASSTPPMVDGSGEPILSAAELTERYSALNLQYWALLTRMVDNAGMASAPDVWRHRSKRGYRLVDIVRNYIRQENHYRSTGLRKVTMDALLYTARVNYDHIPAKAQLVRDGSVPSNNGRKGENSRPHNPANEGVLEWGDLGLEANIFEALAKDEQDLKDSLGGSLPGSGVPPFWMFGVVE